MYPVFEGDGGRGQQWQIKQRSSKYNFYFVLAYRAKEWSAKGLFQNCELPTTSVTY